LGDLSVKIPRLTSSQYIFSQKPLFFSALCSCGFCFFLSPFRSKVSCLPGRRSGCNTLPLPTLDSAVSFTLHIFLVGRYAPETDAVLLTAAQILAVALLSAASCLIFPQPPIHFTPNAWLGILLTAIPATSLALFIQIKMQQFTSSSHTALIFAAESVFGALAAFLLAGETLTRRGYFGAGLVLLGILVAEFTGPEKRKIIRIKIR